MTNEEHVAKETEKKMPRIATICSSSLILLLIFAIFFHNSFTTIQVQGDSMFPTFHNGERLLASHAYWLVGPVRPNDVIVVSGEDPGEYMIKRVYKLEGETVDWLNVPETHSIAKGEYVVPKGDVYILGDNREVSEDSRRYGSVSTNRILGKIVLKRWL
jgi:signal peptidase I